MNFELLQGVALLDLEDKTLESLNILLLLPPTGEYESLWEPAEGGLLKDLATPKRWDLEERVEIIFGVECMDGVRVPSIPARTGTAFSDRNRVVNCFSNVVQF